MILFMMTWCLWTEVDCRGGEGGERKDEDVSRRRRENEADVEILRATFQHHHISLLETVDIDVQQEDQEGLSGDGGGSMRSKRTKSTADVVRIYADEPLFNRRPRSPFDPMNETSSVVTSEKIEREGMLRVYRDNHRLSACDGHSIKTTPCFLALPTRSDRFPASAWLRWLVRNLDTESHGFNEIIVVVVVDDEYVDAPTDNGDVTYAFDCCEPGDHESALTNFANLSVYVRDVSCEPAWPRHVYHDYVDVGVVETSGGDDAVLVEAGTGSKENLFARAAEKLGFGIDTFIDPIAGGAVGNIISDLLQKFIVYFTSCINARFSGFLLGWENDVGRPVVIVWDVMDMMKELDKVMAMIQLKMDEIKTAAEIAMGIALGEVEAAKIEAENAKIEAKAAADLAIALALGQLAELKSMADAAMAQALAMAEQAAALAAAAMAEAMAMAAAAKAAALAAAQAAAAALAQMQAFLAAQAAGAMAAAAGMMDMAKNDATGQLAALANGAKTKADSAARAAKIASDASKAQANALAAEARSKAAAASAKAKVAASAAAAKRVEVLKKQIEKRKAEQLANRTTGESSTETTVDVVDLVNSTNKTVNDTTSRSETSTAVSTEEGAATTTEMPCDPEFEQCEYPKSAQVSYTHAAPGSGDAVRPAVVRVGMTETEDLENTRDELSALLLEWSGKDNDESDVSSSSSANAAPLVVDDSFRFQQDQRQGVSVEMAIAAARTRTRVSATTALRAALDAIRTVRDISVDTGSIENDATVGDLRDVEMKPAAIKKWGRRLLEHIDAHDIPRRTSKDTPSPPNKGDGDIRSALLEELATKRVNLPGTPKEEDGGIVKILTKVLTKSLTSDLSLSLTESISTLLHERMSRLVVADLQETLPDDISAHLEPALSSSVGESVSFAVSSIIRRVLPAYLSNSIRDTLTRTLTRGLTHSLTPTLIHTIRSSPEKARLIYPCQRCLRGHRVTSESKTIPQACTGVCPDSVLADMRAENHALRYAYVYASYYSDYYASYYLGNPHPHPENAKATESGTHAE